MKKNNFIKQALVALTFAVAVAVMIPAVNSVEAQAAKKITAKANFKKAPKAKLKTTYKVISKSKKGTYVKFTAPKTGKYVITISNLNYVNPKANAEGLANFYIRKKYSSSNSLSLENVKTQGGKSYCLFMATPYRYNRVYKDQKVTTGTYLKKRTGTISLKAGETIYVNMSIFTGHKKYYCSYNLKITKK